MAVHEVAPWFARPAHVPKMARKERSGPTRAHPQRKGRRQVRAVPVPPPGEPSRRPVTGQASIAPGKTPARSPSAYPTVDGPCLGVRLEPPLPSYVVAARPPYPGARLTAVARPRRKVATADDGVAASWPRAQSRTRALAGMVDGVG